MATAVRMKTKKGSLLVALLVGWMVSVAGADESSKDSAKVESETTATVSPFKGGLPKRKDRVKSDSGVGEAETGEQKRPNGSPFAGGLPKDTDQMETETAAKEKNKQPSDGTAAKKERTGGGQRAEKELPRTKADASEKMKKSLRALESIGNTSQKGLDQAFGNMDKANKAIESLGKDERKDDWDTDFLIPME